MGERTENDVLSRKPIEVILGEKTYQIKPQVMMRSREFRLKFQELTETFTLDDLRGNDALMDLIYLYSPELAGDRQYIEENGFDDQMIDAFVAITGLALGPFVGVEQRVINVLRGVSDTPAKEAEKSPESQSTTKP